MPMSLSLPLCGDKPMSGIREDLAVVCSNGKKNNCIKTNLCILSSARTAVQGFMQFHHRFPYGLDFDGSRFS